jgi:hypothetical protein
MPVPDHRAAPKEPDVTEEHADPKPVSSGGREGVRYLALVIVVEAAWLAIVGFLAYRLLAPG